MSWHFFCWIRKNGHNNFGHFLTGKTHVAKSIWESNIGRRMQERSIDDHTVGKYKYFEHHFRFLHTRKYVHANDRVCHVKCSIFGACDIERNGDEFQLREELVKILSFRHLVYLILPAEVKWKFQEFHSVGVAFWWWRLRWIWQQQLPTNCNEAMDDDGHYKKRRGGRRWSAAAGPLNYYSGDSIGWMLLVGTLAPVAVPELLR